MNLKSLIMVSIATIPVGFSVGCDQENPRQTQIIKNQEARLKTRETEIMLLKQSGLATTNALVTAEFQRDAWSNEVGALNWVFVCEPEQRAAIIARLEPWASNNVMCFIYNVFTNSYHAGMDAQSNWDWARIERLTVENQNAWKKIAGLSAQIDDLNHLRRQTEIDREDQRYLQERQADAAERAARAAEDQAFSTEQMLEDQEFNRIWQLLRH
jgi:hypothetical protein